MRRLRGGFRRPANQVAADVTDAVDTDSFEILALPPQHHEQQQPRPDGVRHKAKHKIGGVRLRRFRDVRGQSRRFESLEVVRFENRLGRESQLTGITTHVPAHERRSGEPIERVRFECLDRLPIEVEHDRNLPDATVRRFPGLAQACARADVVGELDRRGGVIHRDRLKAPAPPGRVAAHAVRRPAGCAARRGRRAVRRRRRCRRRGSCG